MAEQIAFFVDLASKNELQLFIIFKTCFKAAKWHFFDSWKTIDRGVDPCWSSVLESWKLPESSLEDAQAPIKEDMFRSRLRE